METREFRKATIMVIDDDLINIGIARGILKSKYNVVTAGSGKEAFELLKTMIPDLILLDLHMPEMNGYEVIHRLKEKEAYKSIPVIFLTADEDGEAEVLGFAEGALDFITKPFRKDIVLQRISRILELDYLQKNLEAEVDRQSNKAEERGKKMERLALQMIHTLVNAIDAKDPYTNGHSARVAEYSVMIAERMGYNEEELVKVRYMALVHDIGKIGIPDAIINKTTQLTGEEYEIVRAHPVIGGNILKDITEIPEIATGARWHHEMYDGSGYPDHLAGDEIPEIARIIAVADTYDAMTSKRSYRDILPQQVVRAEIVKGRGIQFDPEMADIMVQLMDEDTEYYLREKGEKNDF